MTTPDEPAPQEALGLAGIRGAAVGMSHHKVGFDERAARTEEVAAEQFNGPMTSVLPPSDPDLVSHRSLTELARARARNYGEATT